MNRLDKYAPFILQWYIPFFFLISLLGFISLMIGWSPLGFGIPLICWLFCCLGYFVKLSFKKRIDYWSLLAGVLSLAWMVGGLTGAIFDKWEPGVNTTMPQVAALVVLAPLFMATLVLIKFFKGMQAPINREYSWDDFKFDLLQKKQLWTLRRSKWKKQMKAIYAVILKFIRLINRGQKRIKKHIATQQSKADPPLEDVTDQKQEASQVWLAVPPDEEDELSGITVPEFTITDTRSIISKPSSLQTVAITQRKSEPLSITEDSKITSVNKNHLESTDQNQVQVFKSNELINKESRIDEHLSEEKIPAKVVATGFWPTVPKEKKEAVPSNETKNQNEKAKTDSDFWPKFQ